MTTEPRARYNSSGTTARSEGMSATTSRPQERKSKTLHVESLQKSYSGRRVVDGVSFTVSRGEVVGLLGRNGAGKTTSFDMVVGLVKPEKGIIRLENNDLTKTPIHYRSRLGI